MTDSYNRRKASRALDAANFFLADMRRGLGPYLAIFLLTGPQWGEARIGIVMSVATVSGIMGQTPAGALVDATRAKRQVMVATALIVTVSSLLLPLFPSFWPVAVSQGIANAAAAAIAGAAAFKFGPQVVFYLLAAMSIASLTSVLAIPEIAIDHDLARGLHNAGDGVRGRLRTPTS